MSTVPIACDAPTDDQLLAAFVAYLRSKQDEDIAEQRWRQLAKKAGPDRVAAMHARIATSMERL